MCRISDTLMPCYAIILFCLDVEYFLTDSGLSEVVLRWLTITSFSSEIHISLCLICCMFLAPASYLTDRYANRYTDRLLSARERILLNYSFKIATGSQWFCNTVCGLTWASVTFQYKWFHTNTPWQHINSVVWS